jgi:hypothetical protein
MRLVLFGSALLFAVLTLIANDRPAANQAQFPPSYIPSGQLMYKNYCAACHGAVAKGNGPTASMLKTPPPDLTTLAKRHMGKFPYDYVSSVLRFGPGLLRTALQICLRGDLSFTSSIRTTKRQCSGASIISAII